MRRPLALIALLLLAACSKPGESRHGAARSAAEHAAAPVAVDQTSDTLHFAYSWPAEAAAIPALDHRFREDLAKARAEAQATALDGRKTAHGPGWQFHPHEFARRWTSAGATPRLLSLAEDTSFFTGGAHPDSGVDSLLWDRQLGREIGVADLFDPPTRFAELFSIAYCQALDFERERRRGGARLPGEFNDCPNLSDLALVPTDADHDGRFEAIHFIASPYVAGPYVEGRYDVAMPINAAALAAMKPAYRASFVSRNSPAPAAAAPASAAATSRP